MDKALELACRFSYITNRLRYCGPKDAFKDFRLALEGKRYNNKKIKDELRRYEGLSVYLESIGAINSLDMFDYKVIESYWLGNDLLDSFTKNDLKKIIFKLIKKGLPKTYASDLANRIPDGMNPSHSFNVLFVGVGRTTGAVPTNIITINKCLILDAKILKVTDRQLIVNTTPLTISKGVLKNSKSEIQYIDYIKELLPRLKVGDNIAIHWDFACKLLNNKEVGNLRKYTQLNIDALNQALFFSSGSMPQ